jgi:hypothetical protein
VAFDGAEPAVRHLALRRLQDLPADDPDVVAACRAAMASPPISTILEAQDPEGWWVKPGPSYGPKYRSTTWNLIFLDQLGADGEDPRMRRACEYVLAHDLVPGAGSGSARKTKPRRHSSCTASTATSPGRHRLRWGDDRGPGGDRAGDRRHPRHPATGLEGR